MTKLSPSAQFENRSYASLVTSAKEHIIRVQNNRREWEIKAYVNLMMKEGYHYINDRGRPDIRDSNQMRRIINKFRSTLRSLKNSITFNMPIVDVLPERGQEQMDQQELDLASYICTGEYKKNNMRDILRTVIEDSALKSFGILSVLPNMEDGEDDERIVDLKVYDPFDVYYDNPDMTQAQLVVVSSAETKKPLMAKGYDLSNVHNAGNLKSHSALKNEFERKEGKDPDPNVVLIDYVFMMLYKEDDKGIVEKGEKPKVVWFIKAGDAMIKAPEELKGYKNLGEIFFLYFMEQAPHVPYPTPWASDAVPMQRSLDEASENLDTLSHWYSKVRLLQQMGESNYTQMFEDKHVQIVKYEGAKPEFAVPPNVPAELFNLVAQRENQIEDMMGVHAASMGKLVSSGASGRLQALAQAADMDNVSEATTNLQTFLERVFTRVLEIASTHVDQEMRFYSTGSDDQSFLAIGEEAFKALSEDRKKMVKPIRKFHNVQVTMQPGSMFTVQQSKQEVLELIPMLTNAGLESEAQAMFPVMLRLFAPGGTRDIAKAIEIKTKEIEEQNADVKIVQFEIVKLAQGDKVTATPEQPHEIHIQLKTAALQKIIEKYGEEDAIVQNFKENLAQHSAMMTAPPTPQTPAPAPVAGETQIPVTA